MHILFITDNFPPEINAPATRTVEHCERWVAEGNEVTVITCAPNFPKGILFEGYKNNIYVTETIRGVKVIRVWSYIASNSGTIKRIADYMSFMVSAFFAGLFVKKIDIIIATSPQFFTTWAAAALSKVKKAPWIFELRDIWPESIIAVGALRDGLIFKLLEKIEIMLYESATKIVSVSGGFKKNLVRRGVSAEKICTVMNGVDLEAFQPKPTSLPLRGRYHINTPFLVGYIGTHGLAHGLQSILETASLAQKDEQLADIGFVFLGEGEKKEWLKNVAETLELRNVFFLDSVEKKEIGEHIAMLDAAIVHLRASNLFHSVIPSKIFEFMAMGIPIIHCVEGESATIVSESGAGLLLPPENPVEILNAIKSLRDNPELKSKLAEHGVAAAQRYDRQAMAMEMLEHIKASI